MFPKRRKFQLISIGSASFLLFGLFMTLSAVAAPPVRIAAQDAEVSFLGQDITVQETAGSVTLDVGVVNHTDVVTVSFRTIAGTAQPGTDFTAVANGVITFPVGTNSRQIQITIREDPTSFQDKFFTVVLQQATNAVVRPGGSTATVNIQNVNSSPTPTNTPGSAATPIYSDRYEANNSLQTAFSLSVGDTTFCSTPDATLWPAGDQDFYRFWLNGNATYTFKTDKLSNGLDTVMVVYGTEGELIATNDDFNGVNSQVTFEPTVSGNHFVMIYNKSGIDPANKVYCLSSTQSIPTVTPTPTPRPTDTPIPTATTVPGADICEINNNFDQACTVGDGVQATYTFVPAEGTGPDNDFYRLWVKPGIYYTCETLNLSAVTDTNLILYDQNKNGIGGNDDRAPGDLSSTVSFYANYTGWLYILVGPVNPPPYAESDRHFYDLLCSSAVVTPTPAPTLTPTPFVGSGSGGGGFVSPTRTPTATSTPEGPPTPDFALTIAALQPTAVPTTIVQIMPLPTATPAQPSTQTVDLTTIVYYDTNDDRIPQMNEGIQDMSVFVYDGVTGQLLSFGYTNEAGMLRFTLSASSNLIRVSVPFLGFNQVTSAATSEVVIRVPPSN